MSLSFRGRRPQHHGFTKLIKQENQLKLDSKQFFKNGHCE